jgi:hypothetical protein
VQVRTSTLFHPFTSQFLKLIAYSTSQYILPSPASSVFAPVELQIGAELTLPMHLSGWGDVGFVNRWTMEITNNSRHYSIPLVVGRRIAQIVFFDTQGTLDSRSYSDTGKYQTSGDLQALKVRPRLLHPIETSLHSFSFIFHPIEYLVFQILCTCDHKDIALICLHCRMHGSRMICCRRSAAGSTYFSLMLTFGLPADVSG